MSSTHVNLFVVPASHLGELRDLEKHADEAEGRRDEFYCWNQVLVRAGQVALASVILDQDKYKHPAGSLWAWMNERIRGGKDRNVVDADEFEAIRKALSTPRVDDLLQWADAHSNGYGDVDRAVLVEIFDAMVKMVRSVPRGPHGFVYGYFFERHREPPAPPPERTPRRPVSEQDKKWLAASWKRRVHRISERAHWDDWPEEEYTEGRFILGLVPRERAAMLRPAYLNAWRVMFEQGRTEGHALLKELTQQLEHDLIQPTIVARAGPVRAHTWLHHKAKWSQSEYGDAGIPATPELAHELRRRLDALEQTYGGAEGLINEVWLMEAHWSRDTVREAYEQLCDLLDRAMERGHGFVWLLDRDW